MSACQNTTSDLNDEYVFDFTVSLNSGDFYRSKKPTIHSKRGRGNLL